MAKTPTCPQCKIERSPETYTKNCEGCTKYHKQRAYDNKPNKYLEIVTHTTAEQQTCECGTPELQLNDDCKAMPIPALLVVGTGNPVQPMGKP